jgi:recombination protein RecT
MSTATAEKHANPVAVFRHELDAMENQFKAALPAHIPAERFARVVMTAIQNNPKLLGCTRQSLWNACMKAAQDGLLPDGREGAIVPYGEDEEGSGSSKIAQWMPMIAGIRKKARNSGEIAGWEAYCVYENDEFEFELGDDPFIRHKPALSDRGAIIAVYSIATLKDGYKSREVMSVKEIEGVRSKSKAKKGPWKDPIFYPEMCKKVVARRHSKVLPMSGDLDDLIRRDDDLYDLEGAREDAQTARPRSIAGKLDLLAGGKTIDQTPDDRPNLGTNDAEPEATQIDADAPSDDEPQDSAEPEQASQRAPAPKQERMKKARAALAEAERIDPEQWLQDITKKLRAAKDGAALNAIWLADAEPHKDALPPPDFSEAEDTYRACAEKLEGGSG